MKRTSSSFLGAPVDVLISGIAFLKHAAGSSSSLLHIHTNNLLQEVDCFESVTDLHHFISNPYLQHYERDYKSPQPRLVHMRILIRSSVYETKVISHRRTTSVFPQMFLDDPAFDPLGRLQQIHYSHPASLWSQILRPDLLSDIVSHSSTCMDRFALELVVRFSDDFTE